MPQLTSLRNIGTELEKKLKSINITTAEELKKTGSEEAFAKLKVLYPSICLVHLYAIHGAITDTEYNQLPEDVKQSLKTFADQFK